MGAGQSGVMLLEALIAILIFSLGILTVVGIQATSVKMAGDAQLRTRAALLADRLVGEMWASGDSIADLKTKFESPNGSEYARWLLDVQDAGRGGLPGVDAGVDEETCSPPDDVVTTLPTVEVKNGVGTDEFGRVIVKLYWRTPSQSKNDDMCQRHRHIVTSQILRNS
jgi:type IV pilus assembly protein PilV